MLTRSLWLTIVPILLISCSRYEPFLSHYKFKSKSGLPDYSQLDYWAAHPGKWDPSDSVPIPLKDGIRDTSVDVFFLHPTTLTKKTNRKENNAFIDDAYINAKTDYSTILYQASVFNQFSRVYAPRYRQAHIRNFFMKDSSKAQPYFEIAYTDIKNAFEYYLAHYNNGRPIIIAGHSQGSRLAERLLKEYFENKPLAKQLVVAYIPGWPVMKNYFTDLKMCSDSIQTGCVCSWQTVRKGFIPFYLKNRRLDAWTTNPLTWTLTDEYAPKTKNKGSILKDFNKLYRNLIDAQVNQELLFVSKPKFPGSFLFIRRNYHIGDINLFYLNIRHNSFQRVKSYWNLQSR